MRGHAPAGPTRFQRTCHGSFPFPDHGLPSGTLLVVGPPGPPVFHRTCPRATPWLSHLFPTEPSARVRSTWRLGPPGVRPGRLSLFPARRPARRPACLPALLPPVLSPLRLGAKTGSKVGATIGAQRRPPFRRGTRARPASGQAGRREHRHPAEALPLGQVRVWTTLFGPFTVAAWERQAPTRGAPSGSMPPAGRGGPGPFTPLRCPGFGEGLPAVTNPQKSPRFLTRSFATGRGLNFWGLVTAHSRAPRQRSRPTREPSLGLGLTSALPGGRSVGLSVARHIVLGRWRRARSRRHLSIHVNRIGGRSAGADLTACLDLGIESAPRETSATITSTFASINMEVAQERNAAVSSRCLGPEMGGRSQHRRNIQKFGHCS